MCLNHVNRGNELWDYVSLIDTATAESVRAHRGTSALAISRPIYYEAMVEWSRVFDVPIHGTG